MDATRTLLRTLLHRDAAGGSWLAPLLGATPYGQARLGELAEQPGWLQSQLALRTPAGSLGAFEYPAAAPRRLLTWYIDHPERLARAALTEAAGPESVRRLRRTLLDDDPPGARSRAQERARAMLARSSTLSSDWWRFEEPTILDAVLITERLVVVVVDGTHALSAATPWYPPRPRLVRDLEAARHLAVEGKRFAGLVISPRSLPEADDAWVARMLPEAAPHLDAGERETVREAYLGTITTEAAAAAAAAAGAAAAGAAPEPAGDVLRPGGSAEG